MMLNIPLKFGLIRASYPDVFPISLSRKSEGDMVNEKVPLPDALESASLLSTILERRWCGEEVQQ